MATGIGASIQCLEAVEDLHKHGFIHRDLKPANYAIGLGEQVRVVSIKFLWCILEISSQQWKQRNHRKVSEEAWQNRGGRGDVCWHCWLDSYRKLLFSPSVNLLTISEVMQYASVLLANTKKTVFKKLEWLSKSSDIYLGFWHSEEDSQW